MMARRTLVQHEATTLAAEGTPLSKPLAWLLILSVFALIPALWIVGAREFPTKWYAFGILALIVAALIVIFRNNRRFHLALLAFTIGLEIDVHIYYTYTDAFISSHGFYISIALIPLSALYARWIWQVLMGREHFNFRRVLLLPLIFFALLAAWSITQAAYPQFTVWELASLVYCLLFYFYMANNLTSREDVRVIVLGLVLSVVAQSLIALAQFATGSSLGLEVFGEAKDLTAAVGGLTALSRASGTLGHPNTLAMYLDFLLPMVLGAALIASGLLKRAALFASFFLGIAALLATMSRGGMIVSSILLLVFLLFWAKRAEKFGLITSIVLICVATAALLLLMLENPIKTRFVEDPYETAYIRVPLMQVAVRMIEHRFWFGVGLNNYSHVAGDYDYTLERVTTEFPHPVHNMFLLMLGEIGIFGFLAFLVFIVSLLARGYAISKPWDRELTTYGLGLAMGIAAVMFHGFVDYFYLSKNFPFWFLAGSIVGIQRLKQNLTRGTILSRNGAP
jgi:O-antigen ligase